MSFKYLITKIDENIGIITINNPSANTLSTEVVQELNLVLNEFENNNQIRVLIITGYGDKFFVAGAEVREFLNKGAFEGRNLVKNIQIVFNRIENYPKPVIAAINGYCLGGGLELALSCDIRYASENAKLGQPEIALGIIPGGGGTQRLPRLVGKGKAKEMMYTGDYISADEALKIQLVQKTTSLDDLMNECKTLARKIAKKSPLIISLLKEVIDKGTDTPLESGLALEANVFGLCFSSDDKAEGVEAFLEKRKPNFIGR